jgi:hypothetical protein
MGIIIPEYSYQGVELTNVYVTIRGTCRVIKEANYRLVEGPTGATGPSEEPVEEPVEQPQLVYEELPPNYFIMATVFHYFSKTFTRLLVSYDLKIPYTEQSNIYTAIYNNLKTRHPDAIDCL